MCLSAVTPFGIMQCKKCAVQSYCAHAQSVFVSENIRRLNNEKDKLEGEVERLRKMIQGMFTLGKLVYSFVS